MAPNLIWNVTSKNNKKSDFEVLVEKKTVNNKLVLDVILSNPLRFRIEQFDVNDFVSSNQNLTGVSVSDPNASASASASNFSSPMEKNISNQTKKPVRGIS
jgi:hypothetical protein